MKTQSQMRGQARPVWTRRFCVPQLVSAMAATNPDAVALRLSGSELTYAQLNGQAEKWAGYLQSLGVTTESPVALCLDRSFDYVIAALAAWKAGGAYLPLDPTWGVDRREQILEDAGATVLISRSAMFEAGRANSVRVVNVDTDQAALAASAPPQPAETTREQLAYIIYTFGTAGAPKGVEITHGNLLNLVFWHRRAVGISPADRASHVSSPAFDAAMWELWPYLCAGASVTLLPDEGYVSSAAGLRDWLVRERISVAFVPAAVAEPMISSEWPKETELRYMLTGSDSMHRDPAAELPFGVINNYGAATECSDTAASEEPIRRAGDQETIQGHRVKPDEVACALARHPGVFSCVVTGYGEAADRKLAAYFMANPGAYPSPAELRDFLTGQLPAYMVPSAFLRMDAFPMTSNGKLDRAKLPEPSAEPSHSEFVYRAPATPLEIHVAAMVADLLQVNRVGLDDNFFLLGGHSLLGTQLVLRTRERFGVELALRAVFEAQTVAKLALEIERQIMAKVEAMSEEEAVLLLTRIEDGEAAAAVG